MKPKYKPVNKKCRNCSGIGMFKIKYNKFERCACTKIGTQEFYNSRMCDILDYYDNNSEYDIVPPNI